LPVVRKKAVRCRREFDIRPRSLEARRRIWQKAKAKSTAETLRHREEFGKSQRQSDLGFERTNMDRSWA